uniref:RNase H type-1 domain-containing protein n=1 Tax=Chenopodium quinoa TaxID=63459 RepID=A0A803MP61_CHEQI
MILAARFNVDFIFLSETKCSVKSLAPFFSRKGFKNSTGYDAIANKGGMFLCWSDRVVVDVIVVSPNIIRCNITLVDGASYYLACVYGSPYISSREEVWTMIGNLMQSHKGSYILIGDFNQLESIDQKLGGREVINENKSAILFSPNTPARFVRLMSQPIQVKSSKELGIYLGCPIDVDGRTSTKFNYLLERIQKKISSWKFVSLNQPGKLVLINGILVAIAHHILSLYWCPRRITSKINSLINKFWWCSNTTYKGICWRKKEVLFMHKSEGGLGLKDVASINKSLLMKQSWRFYCNPSLLASKIFKAKYGNDPITLGITGKKIVVGSWAAKILVRAAASFKHHIGRRIGSGDSVSIVQDIWVSNRKIQFRHLEEMQGITKVSDLMTSDRRWNAELGMVLWAIWSHRNDIIFRDVSTDPTSVMTAVQIHVTRWQKATDLVSSHIGERQIEFGKSRPMLLWRLGEISGNQFSSVCVDAACKRRKKKDDTQWEAAVAWALEMMDQQHIQGAVRVFASSPNQAEALAVLIALKKIPPDIPNVVIKSDSSVTISALKCPSKVELETRNIITDIHREAGKRAFVLCIKVDRLNVNKAHLLAVKARKSN